MTTKLDVTIDRDKYIGGSDMPAVMGISKFTTRWELLQEKALGKKRSFIGNEYTEYGHLIEPVIREYINDGMGHFKDDEVRIDGDLRYHADGWEESNEAWDGESRLLEIKSTSDFYDHAPLHIDEERAFLRAHYKSYLVQLLLGLRLFKCRIGVLAIYKRPEDMSLEFDPFRLDIFIIRADEWSDLYKEMDAALESFRRDWSKLKENPLLTEHDLEPKDLQALAEEALALELKIVDLKKAEDAAKEMKAKLKEVMQEHGVKKWTMNNGTVIMLIADEEDKMVQSFNKDKFIAENADLAAKYMEEKMKKGRAGYVRIKI